ncbi:hypothetical protein BDN71DRAFT_57736 [Pleurotus eryngii]|uniref:Uncharacterized protein n=1 Tax=Pleurotus eryngii TaxID=5323 RepID=A0A9P6A4G1_PLEER|nr:hypothetical protein BDN71DRAFT_57736 [Pleurotus eryngii]
MPTSTLPFEVLFEFSNNSTEPATLRLLRDLDEFPNEGARIFLHPEESISLVLNAGSVYRYTLKQNDNAAQVTVRIWRDVRVSLKYVFEQRHVRPVDENDTLQRIEGVTITPLAALRWGSTDVGPISRRNSFMRS